MVCAAPFCPSVSLGPRVKRATTPSQASQFVLFEAASGYCLFEAVEVEEIGALKAEVQASVTDLGRFSKLLKLKAFQVRELPPRAEGCSQ